MTTWGRRYSPWSLSLWLERFSDWHGKLRRRR